VVEIGSRYSVYYYLIPALRFVSSCIGQYSFPGVFGFEYVVSCKCGGSCDYYVPCSRTGYSSYYRSRNSFVVIGLVKGVANTDRVKIWVFSVYREGGSLYENNPAFRRLCLCRFWGLCYSFRAWGLFCSALRSLGGGLGALCDLRIGRDLRFCCIYSSFIKVPSL